MENTFINAFAVLEPTTGQDGFTRHQAPRRPSASFEGRIGVNRLFRSNLAFLSDNVEVETKEASEATSFVVEKFLAQPKMA